MTDKNEGRLTCGIHRDICYLDAFLDEVVWVQTSEASIKLSLKNVARIQLLATRVTLSQELRQKPVRHASTDVLYGYMCSSRTR